MIDAVRLVFAGTPRFAAVALDALADAGHDIARVLTQPDRPAGRGLRMVASEVKQAALARGFSVDQPVTLRSADAISQLRAVGADMMIVAAYGLILPQAVLDLFPLGCLNIHASLLPRWRGAAPIQRAILAGDTQTGVAIMRMEAGLDTGPVYLERAIPIASDDTAGTLHDALAHLGAALIVEALPAVVQGRLIARPQPATGVTYAAKIARADAALHWDQPASVLHRTIRAFDPTPGAHAMFGGDTVKIWKADVVSGQPDAPPGTVLATEPTGIVVAAGEGSALQVSVLQKAGGRRLGAAEFLRGQEISVGTRFGNGAS
ncbi:MAG: methionyl-tRNA formyltransferase [Burkholderiales bacterium]|nr:methionyl-tRNA formyltransferase [Burkholderiales bacterium]